MNAPTVEISVVIVAWKAKPYLDLCLDSLYSHPPCRSMEVLVVDNASDDGTVEMVESQYPQVKLIKSPENLGFSRGNNVAIRQAQGRYIALVNPDIIVFPGCLDSLAEFMDENPRVGNVGPRILNLDHTLQSSCRRFPSLWNNFCATFGLASRFKNSKLFAGEHMFYFAHDRTMPVDVIVGCFSFVRREAFEGVGLLDEGLFMYGDDVDWCRRAWNKGWQVVFYPGAASIHDKGKTTAPYPVRFAVAQQRSVLHYWKKHHTILGILGIGAIMFIHHVLRYAFAVCVMQVGKRARSESQVRMQVSGACLRQLLFGEQPG